MVVRNCKILLDCYGNEEVNEDLTECEDFSCSLKIKSRLSNAEVGATEDLHDGNSAPANLWSIQISVYSLIVCHVPE